jgi:hypothetical protein
MAALIPARVVYSTAFFVLLMGLLIVLRPASVFTDEGDPVPFGVGSGRTMFPLGVITVVAALTSMYAFALVDLIQGAAPP